MKSFIAGCESSAALLILLGSIAFGFFGLISAYAEKYDFSFLLFTAISSAITVVIFGACARVRGQGVKSIYAENTNNSKVIFYNILMTVFRFSTFLLIPAFSYIENKMVGVGIYEAYPVLTVFLGFVFFPKKEDSISQFLVFTPFILLGILLIFGGGEGGFESFGNARSIGDSGSYFGLALIVIATVFAAANTVLGPQVLLQLQKINGKSHFQNSVSNNFFVYGVLSIVSVVIYLLFDLSKESLSQLLSLQFWLLAGASAILVTVIPPVVSSVAGAISRNNSIFLIWLLSPIFSLFLMYEFGFGELNSVMGLGIAIILIVNAVFNNHSKESISFVAIQFVILLVSILVFFVEGGDDTYYRIASFLFVAFTLIASFLITRLQQRVAKEQEVAIEFFKHTSRLKAARGREAMIDFMSLSGRANFDRVHDAYLNMMKRSYSSDLDQSLLHSYVLSRRTRVRYTEHYVLLLLAAILITVLVFYRGTGFIYDMVALVVTATVVLTYFTVIEENILRFKSVFELYDGSNFKLNGKSDSFFAVANLGGGAGSVGIKAVVNTIVLVFSIVLIGLVLFSKYA